LLLHRQYLDLLDEQDICPSLKNFDLGDPSGSMDIPFLKTPEDWRQEKEKPEESGPGDRSGIFLDDDNPAGFEDDDDATTPVTWDDLSWTHFNPDIEFIDTNKKPDFKPQGGDNVDQWGSNAANMAYILYQKPVMIAVHAKEMLEKLES